MNANTTHQSPRLLDPLTLPLNGHRLIEASAGTGKTWTIAALYIRLLLGHGRGEHSAHCQPLQVSQILVVTFTEAATCELRERIGARIHEALHAFATGLSDDFFLKELLADLDDHPLQVERLKKASRDVDQAAIFTIHGFCQRLLKQYAFECQTLFTCELMEDQSELLADSVADFWRRQMYSLDRDLAELVRTIWKTPDELAADLQSWSNSAEMIIDNSGVPASFAQFMERVQQVRSMKAQWRAEQQEIGDLFQNCLKKNSKPYKRLAAMNSFAHSQELVPRKAKEKQTNWQHYTPEALQQACAKGQKGPETALFTSIQSEADQPLALDQALRVLFLKQALACVNSDMEKTRMAEGSMSFDDLLLWVGRALNRPGAEVLAATIQKQFRLAMIDEFQDTDAVQYQIFSKLYPAEQDQLGLLLIGDPKQAIYSFRGADIFTYIQARRAIDNRYTLPTNWRSSAAMIQATNHLFEQARSPFMHDEDIPFEPVSASKAAAGRGLFIQGQEQTAMQIWHQNEGAAAISKSDYEEAMAEACADHINSLLSLAQKGQCTVGSGTNSQPVMPDDVAILVRTGSQALRVARALKARAIDSVYLSDRRSVFASDEAADLGRILTACLSPTCDRSLRAALATGLLGLTAADIERFNSDETTWESVVQEFCEYHSHWLRYGVLSMLYHLVSRRCLAENLLASAGGERRLTDLLHLGQLVAAAARRKASPHALLHWFYQHMAQPNNDATEQQLHLESERRLVKIVTIHKSKGLAYGVVFIPFACTWRPASQAIYHDDKGRLRGDLANRPAALVKADQERLAEDLRLLYVALTRAVHCCYLGVAPISSSRKKGPDTDLNQSALGYLLAADARLTVGLLTERLNKLQQLCSAITITELPPSNTVPYRPTTEATTSLTARTFTGSIDTHTRLTSYSALMQGAPSSYNITATADKKSSPFPASPTRPSKQPDNDTPLTLADFPRGAAAGTFLHGLYEKIVFERPDPSRIATMIKEQLLLQGYDSKWAPLLQSLMERTLSVPLNDSGLRLADLRAGRYRAELTFHLHLDELQASRLNALLRHHDPLAAQAPDLTFARVRGLLQGAIDLVFEADGRWYLLDWKSNWLGPDEQAYTHAAMAQAMIEHRYDLQYLIYTLALHRLLRSRVADYHYETHVGGVFYLFVRGLADNAGGDTGVYAHRPTYALIEALDQMFGQEGSL